MGVKKTLRGAGASVRCDEKVPDKGGDRCSSKATDKGGDRCSSKATDKGGVISAENIKNEIVSYKGGMERKNTCQIKL